jgi:hypothetical protein
MRRRVRQRRVRRGGWRYEGIGERAGTCDAQACTDKGTDQAAAVDVPSHVSTYDFFFLIRHDAHPS